MQNTIILDWENICTKFGIKTFPRPISHALYILCPFHIEKTPSLKMWPENQGGRFHCFGCHTSGTKVDFLKLWLCTNDTTEIENYFGRDVLYCKPISDDKQMLLDL